MITFACQHEHTKKHGLDKNGQQRYRCLSCGKTFIDREHRLLGDLRIDTARAVMVLRMMLEGTSLRTIHRLTGVDRETIGNLLLLVGERCQRFLDTKIRNIPAREIQCDELWSFVTMKERRRVALNRSEELGDCYVFVALDSNTKLVLAYQAGKRDLPNTRIFASRLRDAIAGDCQITTDGFSPYTISLPPALWDKQIRFAQLIKIFGKQQPSEYHRYTPAPITGIIKKVVWDNPDPQRISTSHIERWNLSLRMGLRRFTRLTNAHSKSLRHHEAAIALWITFYNFCRPHMTLKTTPAVKAGLTDSAWTIERLLSEIATS